MTAQLPEDPRGRLLELLSELSLRTGDIELTSGLASTIYVDCKQTALHPEGGWLLGNLLYDLVTTIESETGRTAVGVGGMTLGADPLATAVSLAAWHRGRALPAFIVRKEAKGHGTGTYVEGRRNLPDGSPIILLEDVITTGGSTLKAAGFTREEGLDPFGVANIVDRQAGGEARLEADGLCVRSLVRLDELSA